MRLCPTPPFCDAKYCGCNGSLGNKRLRNAKLKPNSGCKQTRKMMTFHNNDIVSSQLLRSHRPKYFLTKPQTSILTFRPYLYGELTHFISKATLCLSSRHTGSVNGTKGCTILQTQIMKTQQ